jgi:hypothetical protein
MMAMRRFHIIDGKPSLRADAMLALFQIAGGKVTWKQSDDTCCEAAFDAPGLGEPLTVRWAMSDAVRAGVASKQNWTRYPRQMLRARVISEGVRASMAAVCVGLYTPEEVQDFDDKPDRKPKDAPAPSMPQEPIDATYMPPAATAVPCAQAKAYSEADEKAREFAKDVLRRFLPAGTKTKDALAWCGKALGREVTTWDLSADECSRVIDAIEKESEVK